MGIFKQEKMEFNRIVEELDSQISRKEKAPKFEKDKAYVSFSEVGYLQVASLEVNGYLRPRTVRRVIKHFRKKGYSLSLYVIGDAKYPDDSTRVDFGNPAKITRIEVYSY